MSNDNTVNADFLKLFDDDDNDTCYICEIITNANTCVGAPGEMCSKAIKEYLNNPEAPMRVSAVREKIKAVDGLTYRQINQLVQLFQKD